MGTPSPESSASETTPKSMQADSTLHINIGFNTTRLMHGLETLWNIQQKWSAECWSRVASSELNNMFAIFQVLYCPVIEHHLGYKFMGANFPNYPKLNLWSVSFPWVFRGALSFPVSLAHFMLASPQMRMCQGRDSKLKDDNQGLEVQGNSWC